MSAKIQIRFSKKKKQSTLELSPNRNEKKVAEETFSRRFVIEEVQNRYNTWKSSGSIFIHLILHLLILSRNIYEKRVLSRLLLMIIIFITFKFFYARICSYSCSVSEVASMTFVHSKHSFEETWLLHLSHSYLIPRCFCSLCLLRFSFEFTS